MRFIKVNTLLAVKELAKKMNLSPSRITHIITSLEAKGYIIREISEADRRNVLVRLTEKSRPFIEEVSNKHTELHERVMRGIPTESREVMLKAYSELYEYIRRWCESNF